MGDFGFGGSGCVGFGQLIQYWLCWIQRWYCLVLGTISTGSDLMVVLAVKDSSVVRGR